MVQRDWTVAWQSAWYQIDRRHEGMSLAGKTVLVRRLRDGTEQLVYRGQKLTWRKLPTRPKGKPGSVIPARKGDSTPAPGHSWRAMGAAVGKEYWKAVGKGKGASERAKRTGGGLQSALRAAPAFLRPPPCAPTKNNSRDSQERDILS